ncbi:MAG: ABC transporter permease [Candidatus Bathyarchaeia archaeon]
MALRNLRRRKARNVLTIIAIVLGVSLLVGVNVATASAMAEFRRYLSRFWGETDVIIRYGNRMPFSEGNITIVEETPGVEKLISRLGWLARLNNDTRKIVGLVGINYTDDFEYTNYNITDSSEINGTNVVIGNKIAEDYGVEIGYDLSLTIRVYESERWNRTLSLSVIGIYYPTPPITSIDVFIDFTELQKIAGLSGMTSALLVKVEKSAKTTEVRDLLQENLGPEFDVSAPKAEAEQRIEGQRAGFQLGLNIMVMVSLLVSGFLVFNTMFMAVNERIYEIGVLRAIGNSRRQIFFAFLNESILLGVLGASIGILGGLGLSNLFTFLFEQAFQLSKITTVLTPNVALSGFVMGLITVIGGAIFPAFSASRINVIQALRPGVRAGRRTIPDSVPLIVGLALFMIGSIQAFGLIPSIPSVLYVSIFLVPIGLMISAAILVKQAAKILTGPITLVSSSISKVVSKNFRRKLLRNTVSFGIIGITLTFVILLGGIEAGVVEGMEKSIKEAMGADITLISNQTIPKSFEDNLTKMEQVEIATPMGILPSTKVFSDEDESATVVVLVIDPDVFPDVIKYRFVDSSSSEEIYQELASNNESLILPESLANRLGVSVGQNLTVLTTRGGGKNFTVAGIFTGPVLQYIWFGDRPMSESILVSFKSQKVHFDGKDEAWIFFLNLWNKYKEEAGQVADYIDDAYPEYDFGRRTVTLQDLLSIVRDQIRNVFSIIFLILYFAVLICALGVAVTMIMNVTERRREIGLLRSQGMSRRQILGLFLSEAALMGLLGLLIALPCGLITLKGATSTTTITGFWLPYIIPWPVIGQSIAFAFIAAVVGALYPAYRASRLSITRSLQRK